MPKQTTTSTARRRIPARRASSPPSRRRPALPRRTTIKEPQGFVPGLISRVRPKRSPAKGQSGLTARLGKAVSGLTSSGPSAKKIARKPGAKSLVGLAAGAGVGATALLKRRRSADSQGEEESTVTVIETPTSEPDQEVTS